MGLPSFGVDFISVIVAAVASMVVGSLWYSPLMFGNIWAKLMGFDKKEINSAKKKGMAKLYIVNFVASILMAYVLGYLIYFSDINLVSDGVMFGLLIWVGFFVPLLIGSSLWENKPVKLFFINVFYWLVTLVAMSSILTVWR